MKQRRIRRDLVLVFVGLAAGLLLMRFFGGSSSDPRERPLPEGSVTLASETDQTPPTSDDPPRGSLLAKWKPQPMPPPEKKAEQAAKDPAPTPTQDAPAVVQETPPSRAEKDRKPTSALAEQMLAGVLPGIVVETKWEGDRPEEEKLPVNDPKCRPLIGSNTVLSHNFDIEGDRLVGVVVSIEGPPPAKLRVRRREPVLDQHNCRYEPQVVAMEAGELLEIRNSDPLLHNFHARSKPEFNYAMPKQGQKIQWKLGIAQGAIHIGCDVHGFMSAHAYVFDTPAFNVSDQTGVMRFEDLAPGHYTFIAQHPYLEHQRQSIDYDGGAAIVRFTFKKPSIDTKSEELSKR